MPCWIRTSDRRIRNPVLYPAELRALFCGTVGIIADPRSFATDAKKQTAHTFLSCFLKLWRRAKKAPITKAIMAMRLR